MKWKYGQHWTLWLSLFGLSSKQLLLCYTEERKLYILGWNIPLISILILRILENPKLEWQQWWCWTDWSGFKTYWQSYNQRTLCHSNNAVIRLPWNTVGSLLDILKQYATKKKQKNIQWYIGETYFHLV